METRPQYRQYTPEDRPALMEFFMDWFRSYEGRRGMAERLFASIGRRSTVLVAHVDDKIVGYAHAHPDGRSLRFRQAATHPDYRNRRIFTHLLDMIIDAARGREITAEIDPERRHYDTMFRRGFRIVGEEDGLAKIARPARKAHRSLRK